MSCQRTTGAGDLCPTRCSVFKIIPLISIGLFTVGFLPAILTNPDLPLRFKKKHPAPAPFAGRAHRRSAPASLNGREIGYVLSKDYWGRGLMPEAVKAVIQYLFEVENLDFIIAGHFKRNTQSARVIQKCGFAYIKTIPYETQYGTTETSVEHILYNPHKT